jgi:2-polyprenyl-6-methoxyphenol hydroxylase-like FAD-dependent oxidoreductase
MSDTGKTDVLIVGGGPVGLFTALVLARHGCSSTVVERHASPLQAPKAHVLNSRTLEIFRAIGLDVDNMRRLATRLEDSRVVRFKASLKGRDYGSVPFERQDDAVREVTPLPLMNLPQPILERILGEKAAAEPRIDVRRPCTWRSVEQRDGLCRSTLERADGTETIESRYVLACDGAGSSVRTALDIAMEGEASVHSCMTIHFHANLRQVVGEGTAIIYWVINADVAGALIAHDIEHNWVFLRFDGFNPNDALPTTPDEANRIIRRAIGADAEFQIQRVVPWTMTAEVAAQYRKGNVFLVGDAAHRFPPAGGLGLNTGLQDGHNLAWKLAAINQGWADDRVLDSYERERRPVALANSERSLTNMLTAPRLVAALAAAAAHGNDDLPEELQKELQEAIVANSVTFDNHLGLHLGFSYDPARPAPIAAKTYVPRAAPGDRLPHAWFGSTTNQSVLDLLHPDSFTLFVAGGGEELKKQAVAAFSPVPLRVVAAAHDTGFPDHWLALSGLDRPAVLLVRPDGHVLAHADGVDADALVTLFGALTELCGKPQVASALQDSARDTQVLA